MKKSILILVMFIMVLIPFPMFTFADSCKSKTLPLKKEKRQETDLPLDAIGRRTPCAPMMCVISENGILIDGVGYHFNLYEVYDEDGTCLISSSSEEDFITFIFIVDENVEVRLYTDNFVFFGWW